MIVEFICGSLTIITVSSLSFTKWLMKWEVGEDIDTKKVSNKRCNVAHHTHLGVNCKHRVGHPGQHLADKDYSTVIWT